MMEPPPMETVYQAISALYDNPNASEKEKASNWLADVQKSLHAWKIADNLLQQKKDMQSCYFAAQTMRSKIQHNFSELPSEAILSLRDALIFHLEGVSPETSQPILTQLSLALADLALQTPLWTNCVSDLIHSFSTKNCYVLIEILTVLPQEIDSSSLKLGENRREQIKNELKANSTIVSNFLKESLNSSQNSSITLKVVKCMTSWIQVKAINMQEIPQNAVIGFCLQVLRHHMTVNTLHDAAADCICVLLHRFEENNNDDSIERLLFESLAELENSYHMTVAQEEEVKAANYARVFTELAETFLDKIIASAASGEHHFAIRSLELALMCVGHPDYEVAEITFNLWYRLSEEVYQRDNQPLTDMFKPHIERLIAALARHCQCEPDHPQLPDEGDDFHEFRSKVMELIKDVVFIVGSSSVFKQMFTVLQQHSDASWEQTEAALFMMQAVAKNILPEEYEYVPKVVEAILAMESAGPGGGACVLGTCLALLGELAEWLQQHPACLPAVRHALLHALHDARLAPIAARALQKIASQCRGALLCGGGCGGSECGGGGGAGGACGGRGGGAALVAAVRAPHAPPVALALVKALAATISDAPHHILQEAMRDIVAIQTTGLSKLVASDTSIEKGTDRDPVCWLDRIAALFREVAPGDNGAALLPAAEDVWSVLEPAMEKWCSVGRVMERLCRALRFVVRGLGAFAAGLTPRLAAALARAYTAHPHSAVLYLSSILVDEVSGVAACAGALVALADCVMPRALAGLTAAPLHHHPDTVDDMFRLCVRFLQRIPVEFLSSGAIPCVVECARVATALDHRDANCSVMKFLYDLTRHANLPEASNQRNTQVLAAEIVDRHGEELTKAIMEASVLHLHPYMLSEVAEVLLELMIRQKKIGANWLEGALVGLPSDQATPQQRHQFLTAASKAEKIKDMTRLLRDFARLYR